jgi:transcription-repair coupling factor (superfamily II helicase)
MLTSSHDLPLPDLRVLCRALHAGETDLAVGGIVPEARPLVFASLTRAGWKPKPVLCVVPHVAEASALAEGIRLLAPILRTAAAPGEGASPFLGSEPPLAARLEVIRLLIAAAKGELDFVAVPARALLMPIPDPVALAVDTIELTVGQVLDTNKLALQLTELGYRRVDVVEEPGDFALRGWIVDVHGGDELPIRLELDDTRIEHIQAFDASTQRRDGTPLESCTFLPMVLFKADEARRRQLADALDPELGVLAGLIREGVEKRLWWGSLAKVCDSTTWLEMCSDLVVCDRDECRGELERFLGVTEREWQNLSETQVPLPTPEQTLNDVEAIRQALKDPTLFIERIVVNDRKLKWSRLVTHPADSFVRRLPELVPTLRRRRARDMVQILAVGSEGEKKRFHHLLEEGDVVPTAFPPPEGGVALATSLLDRGFVWEERLAVYGRRNLTAAPAPRKRRSAVAAFISDLRDLKPNDLVVHVDHGIGRFDGFRRVTVEGRQLEMLVLTYQRGDSLLVPVERADLIQRFSGGDVDAAPRLDRLGGTAWKRRKARVRKAVREMAAELLRLAAVRKAARGHRFSPDSPWQREFEDAFEYELTPDQKRVVDEIKDDMETELPMDRLLCGDVGYGKTEVAIRAAFKAVLDGKQVAFLAPTTILAGQHLETLKRRMAGFPVEARLLSRFVKGAEVREVLTGLADGRIDIVIGTHRLLASDVKFGDLGLVVVDEEQRFGVAQKERLKQLRTEVDVLAMSATPIPRTLNMSMSGIRDVSLIETPPRDRQAVETSILEFSEDSVREAITFEIERGGQIFFVHNRVRSIAAFADWVRRVVPEARLVVAHGQMPEKMLERAMRTFLDGDADVLLATAIIENGLDIPNANTLLVNRADRFGLAQLYQLRGRVGRSERLGFAYFLVPPGQPLSGTARARLGAVQEFCELGSGFRIAARDLEIRGAGNLLGAEQHGFLEAVGFETYCQLLEEAVAELEGVTMPQRREIELRLGVDVQLPETYISEPALRLAFYKRLTGCQGDEELGALLEETADRYGPAPVQLQNLATVQRIRRSAQHAGLRRISLNGQLWVLELDPTSSKLPNLAEVLSRHEGAQITPKGQVRVPCAPGERLQQLVELVSALAV